MMSIILATNNQHKLQEFQQLLAGKSITVVAQSELNIPEIAETGLTFVENAIQKARHACANSGLPALADDSGLEVDALSGQPGIHSARYAGDKATAAANIAKLLQNLAQTPNEQRTARFQCVIVYLKHATDPTPLICQGTWDGKILFAPQGTNGFGYDPIFWVPSHNCSAAELGPASKNQISHRGQALQQLISVLKL